MRRINRNKGFSLVELIVVIVIMAVLVGVIAPQFLGYVERTKRAVDETNLDNLNRITRVYATEENIIEGDIFEGFDTNEARMDELIDSGFLGSIPEPKMDDAQFEWSVAFQIWYSSIYEVNENGETSVTYIFGGTNADDYVTTNSWSENENGLLSGYGRLFLENPNDEYTISVTAKLSEGTNGGYGIFFDSKYEADESNFDKSLDTGYIVQFDRGLNGILIDYRDGKTTSQGGTRQTFIDYDDNSFLPTGKDDSWWTEEHEITMDVSNYDEENNTKTMTLKIDGEVIVENFEFESTVTAAENHTGFRSWTEETEYNELSITGK